MCNCQFLKCLQTPKLQILSKLNIVDRRSAAKPEQVIHL
jgi:hypothetical protein